MLGKDSINKTIKTLIISDFFLLSSVGFLTPIYAVFVLENISEQIEVIGYAILIYWMVRVIMVTPLSLIMDKINGETDEFFFMVGGTFMISILPLFYIISSEPWHIYLIQVGNGIAYAMAVPAWRILFTNNVDRRIVGLEWSLEDVSVGTATGLAAILGALIVSNLGFDILFLVISIFGFISFSILLTLNQNKRTYIKKIFSRRPGSRAPLKINSIK